MGDTIKIRPALRQIFIENTASILFIAALVVVSFYIKSPYGNIALIIAAIIALCVGYRVAYLKSIVFSLTDQQLISDSGVFSRERNFTELYRVVDFTERRSFMQQLFGLKTVVIYSGDKLTPKIEMPGIKSGNDVIADLRHRVEQNKIRRGIYEITNR